MKEQCGTLMCVQVCMTILLNFDLKVKFLVLIHQLLSTRKTLETSKDLEDDLKEGQKKVKALIRRCLEDPNENKSDGFKL